MRLTFNLALPKLRVGHGDGGFRHFKPLLFCLEALTQVNEWHLRQQKYPLLYETGVRYEAEPIGLEEWQDIPTLYENKIGDCEDLACARVAELRVYRGIKARPDIKWRQIDGVTLIHCLVIHPNGRVEDPSKLLGMKGAYQ